MSLERVSTPLRVIRDPPVDGLYHRLRPSHWVQLERLSILAQFIRDTIGILLSDVLAFVLLKYIISIWEDICLLEFFLRCLLWTYMS